MNLESKLKKYFSNSIKLLVDKQPIGMVTCRFDEKYIIIKALNPFAIYRQIFIDLEDSTFKFKSCNNLEITYYNGNKQIFTKLQ